MTRIAFRTWLAVTVVAVTAAWPAPAGADPLTDLKAKIGQTQQLVKDLTSRRQAQQSQVDALRSVVGNHVAELRRVDSELVAAAGRFRQAEADLARVEQEMRDLEEQIAQKEQAVQQRADAYGTRLRALYKFTRTSPLEQLFAARNFSDALRRMTMMQAITRVDNRLLGQLRTEQQELLAAREQLTAKHAEQAALRDELDRQRQAVAERRAEQAALVAAVQQEQRQAEAALSQLDQASNDAAGRIVGYQNQYQRQLEEIERQRLEALRILEEQRRAAQATATAQARAQATAQASRPAAAAAPPGRGPGAAGVVPLPGSISTAQLQPSAFNMVYPVMNPVVTTEYGERTFAQSFHTGIDLAQKVRTPVLAVADGIVLEAGLAVPGNASQSYGMMVVVGHGLSLSTLYAHLDDGGYAPPVKPGDLVKRGQIIGYIGMTGLTSGPHLHFEVRVNGQHRNPRLYLPGA